MKKSTSLVFVALLTATSFFAVSASEFEESYYKNKAKSFIYHLKNVYTKYGLEVPSEFVMQSAGWLHAKSQMKTAEELLQGTGGNFLSEDTEALEVAQYGKHLVHAKEDSCRKCGLLAGVGLVYASMLRQICFDVAKNKGGKGTWEEFKKTYEVTLNAIEAGEDKQIRGLAKLFMLFIKATILEESRALATAILNELEPN